MAEQYSIWVVPPEPYYTRLKTTVEKLAAKYNGPIFEPHMTIVGNVEKELSAFQEGIEHVVANMKPFEVSIGPISFSTTYFQSVFVRVNSNAHLMNLNMGVKKQFGLDNGVFMPHMSLLYGDHPMDIREKAARELQPIEGTFTINELIITPATQDLKTWEHVAKIPID